MRPRRGPTEDTFMSLPLLRQFIILDMALGALVVHQVRRDLHTGLTFTRATTNTRTEQPHASQKPHS